MHKYCKTKVQEEQLVAKERSAWMTSETQLRDYDMDKISFDSIHFLGAPVLTNKYIF